MTDETPAPDATPTTDANPATDETTPRPFDVFRAATRTLSGARPRTMAEQLAVLAASGVDLDRAPDMYGAGIVAELEERVAGLLGKPAAAFFPTGTMTQQIALRIWADRAGITTVALHPLHHTEMYENKAYATLSGLRAVWPTPEPRHPSAEEITAIPEPFAALAIELPLREPGFVLPTWDELTAMCAAARDRGAAVHVDGARLWESVPYLGHDLPEIAALADTVYVSFYKSLGGLSGAVLAGDADVIATAKRWRHRYGGQMFTQWPAVVSALAGLDRELPRLASYVEHAKVVAAALASLPGARVYPDPPHTHQFQLWLPYPAEVLNAATLRMADEDGIRFVPGWSTQLPGDRSRAEVTVGADALGWTAEDVIAAGTAFLDRVRTLVTSAGS